MIASFRSQQLPRRKVIHKNQYSDLLPSKILHTLLNKRQILAQFHTLCDENKARIQADVDQILK